MLWQKAVAVATAANVPTLIWGPPGAGKTSFIRCLARAMNLPLEVVIGSLREPSDFLGLPVVVEGNGVKMEPPAWAKRLTEAGDGILFFDELTTCPPSIQAAQLRVIHEGWVGDMPLPPKVRRIAAANPPEQVSGWDLSLPLANRFFHVTAEPMSADEWAMALVSGEWPAAAVSLPQESAWGIASGIVGGFVRSRPSALLQIPKDDGRGEAWPSPRSWEMAATLLAAAAALEGGRITANELVLTLASGSVGAGVAREFVAWIQAADLPDPMEVLKDPKKFIVHKRDDINFATLSAVAGVAVGEVKAKREAGKMFTAAWDILGAICDAGRPDVAVPAARVLTHAYNVDLPAPKSMLKFKQILGATS